MAKRKLRVGIIGCGVMGQNHIRTYKNIEHVELVGIADINEELVTETANIYNTKGYTDYEDLLCEKLDIISIAVPTLLHKEVALKSIETGANILIEKPIADTVENAREIVSAAKNKNVKLMVGHIERFNPAVSEFKNIISSGTLGNLSSISSRRVGPYPKRGYDVGVILDLGTHDIDIISYLYDHRVNDVYAVAGRYIHPFEDHASLMIRFSNGCAGIIETNWLTSNKLRKLSVVGLKGIASLNFIEQKIEIFENGIEQKEINVNFKDPLLSEIEHFIDVVENGGEPLVTGEDSIHALVVALAAIESYKCGKVMKITGDTWHPVL